MPTQAMDQRQFDLKAESAILEELAASPLEPKILEARVCKKAGVKPPSYKVALNAVLAARKIHGHLKLGKNGRPTTKLECYVLGAPPPPPPPPRELAPREILNALGDGALPPAELKQLVRKKLAGLSVAEVDEVLTELVSAGKIHEQHKIGKGGKPGKGVEKYALGGPPMELFITPVLLVWNRARAHALSVGVREPALVDALLTALGVEGRQGSAKNSDRGDQDVLMAGLRELVAREGVGALIAIRKLRGSVPLSKERFDSAMLELFARDSVILHHHDYVGSLTEAERDELVVDQYGNHYVGVALSGNQ